MKKEQRTSSVNKDNTNLKVLSGTKPKHYRLAKLITTLYEIEQENKK